MYRYSNGQISLADFKQPVGMNLKESNRWVKKAQTIPWPEIEKRYAALLTSRFRRTHIFSISAGILAMMMKSCPLLRL